MDKEKKHMIAFIPGAVILDKLKRIQEKRGIMSVTETLRYCISETHAKEFKDYIEVQRQRALIDPKEKAIIKADASIEAEARREKAKLDKARNHAIGLCNAMNGEVVIDPTTGFESCRYTMYNMSSPWIINEHEVTEPLDILNDETPSLQYQGLMNERGEEGKRVIDAARIRIANKLGAGTQ